jgi:hypothetical protein
LLFHYDVASRKAPWHLYEGDEAAWARIHAHNVIKPCARLLPLAGRIDIDWTSHRGWFDDLVRIQRQRAADEDKPWDGILGEREAPMIALTPDVLRATEYRMPEGVNVRKLDALVPKIGSVSFSPSFAHNNW